jgi:hypothetical protein
MLTREKVCTDLRAPALPDVFDLSDGVWLSTSVLLLQLEFSSTEQFLTGHLQLNQKLYQLYPFSVFHRQA